jgi:hypothetical protein
MFNQNVVLASTDTPDKFYIVVTDPELTTLYKKYKGTVSINIGRPIASKTDAQNKAVHALMNAVFDTGMHSSPALTQGAFKLWCKMQFGPCFDWEMDGVPCKIPSKSWADYTIEEATTFISRFLDFIDRIGAYAASKDVQRIIDGMHKGD